MKTRELCLSWIVLIGVGVLAPASARGADARAEEPLKKKSAEHDVKAAPTNTAGSTLRLATPAELERLYLDGRITAKEYQRKLSEYKAFVATHTNQALQVKAAATPATNIPAPASVVAAATPAAKAPAPAPPAKPAQAPPPSTSAEANPEDKKLAEVEAKFDELLKKKADREKTARQATQPPPTNAPPARALTKRDKLDALLKDLIDGKLTEADYNAKRAKVIAEPE
ncbi:MAG TPA: hypothetical protein VNO52_13735 [Methylomirabilota bacterium]|nr:hypothetical protein [Methylomirabilota bacterium]